MSRLLSIKNPFRRSRSSSRDNRKEDLSDKLSERSHSTNVSIPIMARMLTLLNVLRYGQELQSEEINDNCFGLRTLYPPEDENFIPTQPQQIE
jgi:hypothetical protein